MTASSKRVAIMLYEGVNAVDVAGPMEAFAAVPRVDGMPAYTLCCWSLDVMQVRSECGLRLGADGRPPAKPKGDLLIIPGGVGIREPRTLERLGQWIGAHHSGFARIASICTGAYALAQSRLADGLTLTTHWAHATDLARRYPKVTIRSDTLFSENGKFLSSGGVTAGIDLALAVIERHYGSKAAMAAARELVVFLRRTGSQAQFSEPLKMQYSAAGGLADVCLWATNHLERDLSIEALAARANLSARQFTRRFKESFGNSPARHIAMLRLDAARAALSQGRMSIEQIAHTSGFRSVDGFRRAFERRFRINPGEYRRRFAPAGTTT